MMLTIFFINSNLPLPTLICQPFYEHFKAFFELTIVSTNDVFDHVTTGKRKP